MEDKKYEAPTKLEIYKLHEKVCESFLHRMATMFESENIVGVQQEIMKFSRWLNTLQEELDCFSSK